MITKKVIGEKILRRINGGDYELSSKIKKQDVYLALETSYSDVVQEYVNGNDEFVTSEFVTTYENVPVLKNINRNKLYSVLPAQLISLKSGKGLRQISGLQDEQAVFIPQNSGDEGLFSGLEASNIAGAVGYWLEGSTIIYKNMPAYYEGKNVMVKMISSIYSLDESDYIPMPAGLEGKLEDTVLQRLMIEKQIPEDKVADNNPNV